MKTKIETVINDITTVNSEIERLYTDGIVDGFTKEPLPYRRINILSKRTYSNCSVELRAENDLDKQYMEAKKLPRPQ